MLYWIWLSLRRGLGVIRQRQLLEQFGSPEALYHAGQEELARQGIPPRLQAVLLEKDLSSARTVLEHCEEAGLRVLTPAEADYPAALRLLNDAPSVLYCRGQLPKNDRPVVGLVGSRGADERALSLARRLGSEIAACGGVVATGMAKGIDAAGAEGALSQGGAVIGVLGCGPDLVYPTENAALFAEVAGQGCLLSEYPPGTPPRARHFPVRNRLISALSDAVTVVRAAAQSGSLITAQWAAEQGRDVFAVPGAPDDPLSRGCNELLRGGAYAAETGWDILQRYVFRYPDTVRRSSALPTSAAAPLPPQDRAAAPSPQAVPAPAKGGAAAPPPSLTQEQAAIFSALKDGPLQLDALIHRTGLPAPQVLSQLTLLQIKKLVRQLPGKQYELSGG